MTSGGQDTAIADRTQRSTRWPVATPVRSGCERSTSEGVQDVVKLCVCVFESCTSSETTPG